MGLTGEGQKKKYPREHGQDLQVSLDKSYEFYFCLNITTNLFLRRKCNQGSSFSKWYSNCPGAKQKQLDN